MLELKVQRVCFLKEGFNRETLKNREEVRF